MKRRIPLLIVAAVAVVALPFVGQAATSGAGLTNPKHFFWAPGQSQDPVSTASNDLIYHGGSAGPGAIGVQIKPAVYLIYWGTEWAQGFKTADTDGKPYSSTTLQNYLNLSWPASEGARTRACRRSTAATSPQGRPAVPGSRALNSSRTRGAS